MIDPDCICGSGLNAAECCQPFISHASNPPTAEALMRSRFTAFARRDENYLLETWAAETRPKEIDFSKDNSRWTKLEIVSTKKGLAGDSKGVVEFKAYYTLNGEDYVMNEISRFKKAAGRWCYLDGKVKSVARAGLNTNQGKNAPCPCGSGKKFKRCCGKNT
ncbi:MAG: YchJ family protein [Gammaproteobacteria bacterium]